MRIMAIIITADLQAFQDIPMAGREKRPISQEYSCWNHHHTG